MNNKPLHPVLRLVSSGALSFVLACVWSHAGVGHRWWMAELCLAAAAITFAVPVIVRGDSWQKMVAGALLSLPCLAFVWVLMMVVARL